MAKRFKEHQKLLIRRESRVVLGKRAVNLWLLVLVLLATFLSVAFSAGSMAYLNDKMNDPFTNWVNINRDASLEKISILKYELEQDSIREHFLFDGVQTEISASLDMISPSGHSPLFSILYYEDMSSDLIAAVLSEENVVKHNGISYSISPDSISERSLGIIMTEDALAHLGFDRQNVPAFVDCQQKAEGADSLGFTLSKDGYVRAPLPLLAVVRRLPMNKEIVASKYLFQQLSDDSEDKPFNMNKEEYARNLRFFVPDEANDFEEGALQNVPDTLRSSAIVQTSETVIQERLKTWKKGAVKTVYVGFPGTPIETINAIERDILDRYKERGVSRVYDYSESQKTNDSYEQRGTSLDDVISAHFVRLDSIRAFERYVKEVSELQIEMSQVNSKENFNAVSVMATILSAAMIIFSITCIIIFIANMLQSYFQKVKRNMGTFKAFGISTRELMGVYIVIITLIVIAALAIALSITWLTQLLLPLIGIMKDGEYSYLLLWNAKALWAIAIIIVATFFTVVFVMHRLLRQTPGNLIYDR